MNHSRTGRPFLPVRVDHASLGPAVEPGRSLAEALARVLGSPSAPDGVRLVEVRRGSTLAWPALGPARIFVPGCGEGSGEGSGEGAGCLAMDAPAAFRLLDRALGGPPGRPQPARTLTGVEIHVWRRAVEPLLQVLGPLAPDPEEDPVETGGIPRNQEAITWHLAWEDGSPCSGPSCPGPSWRDSRRQEFQRHEAPPREAPPGEASICLGLDVVSARRWMDAVQPPPPDVSEVLSDCVCRMTATLPLTVGRLQTTVGGVASWQPGRVVLLDTPGEAPWHADLGDVRFEGGPALVAGTPHLLVTGRKSDVPAPARTPGPELRAGGGNRAHC